MDDTVCTSCGIEMKENDLAYGISRGFIDEPGYGFRIDEVSEWDLYCPDCMNEIDKVLSDYKRMRGK